MTERVSDATQQMPSKEAETLARRVMALRETIGVTQERLARVAHLSLQQIQDIEAGLDLFLAPAVRQRLARALKTSPATLQAVEKIPVLKESEQVSLETREHLRDEMMAFPYAHYPCPACQTPLTIRVFERRDLEDNLISEVKAHCAQCLFRL
jgi:transcriptional regulator with XRE-family HTH domain